MEDLEQLLMREAPTLDREQVAARSGVPVDLASDVWRAMGFAEVPDAVTAFTEQDVHALTTAAALIELGVIDLDTLLVMARAMGQGMARLAEAQVDVFRALSTELSPDDALAELAQRADQVLPKLDELVLFVWRRQFAAAVMRSMATVREDGMPVLAIGFLDLVGFTRSTRTWDAGQLERILERFERDVQLRVGGVGGRVIKTLGDGVLYTTDSIASAVDIALDTIAEHETVEELPAVRAGVASGPVLVRLGDVFGEPVNIASRLSGEARPDSLLVDRQVAAALETGTGGGGAGRGGAGGGGAGLEGGTGYHVSPLHRRSVRGYRSLTPYLVRRA